jgi:molybdate transport system substrate-binding protein
VVTVLLVPFASLLPSTNAQTEPLRVFAAASLKEVGDTLVARWLRPDTNTHAVVRAVYAGSGTLARQIEQGAPADIFISAASDWMDLLIRDGVIVPSSVRPFANNSLVLIAPVGGRVAGEGSITRLLDAKTPIARWLGDDYLAMGHPDAVPAGYYARAALQKLGHWHIIKRQTARTDNVRAALRLVGRGEAPLGIVYSSDVHNHPLIAVMGRFPSNSHPPIRYPIGQVATSSHPDAADFIAFATGPVGAEVLAANGFGPGQVQ